MLDNDISYDILILSIKQWSSKMNNMDIAEKSIRVAMFWCVSVLTIYIMIAIFNIA